MSDEKKEPDLTLEKLKISEKISQLSERITNLEQKVEVDQAKSGALLKYIGDRINDLHDALARLGEFFQITVYGEKGEDKKGVVERLAFLEGREENRDKERWVFWIPLALGLLIAIGGIVFEAFHKEIVHLMRHWKGVH